MSLPSGERETVPCGVVSLDSVKTNLSSSASTAVSVTMKSVSSGTVTFVGDVMTGGVLTKVVLT